MSGPAAEAALLDALRETLAFSADGDRVANLTVGTGNLDGRPVSVALVENRLASGSLGKAEEARLAPLLETVARDRTPFVLYLDSAGARVSEGLDALGAFRRLFRKALAARTAGAPFAVVLGRHCFGGASMLAHLAARRLFGAHTRLAMSGPAILAQAANTSVLDDMFRAMTDASINATARAKTSEANTVWTPDVDLADWLRTALAAQAEPWDAIRENHLALRGRLAKGLTVRKPEPIRRKEMERLFAEGYQAIECDGLFTGEAKRAGVSVPILGLIGSSHVGAERAWRFAQEAWQLAENPPPRIEVLLDCEAHAARLDDERIILSEFIVDMAFALAALSARGTHVELTVLDRAGGGVYVALAAPAKHVAVVYGADIQVLPGAAVASILGSSRDAVGDVAEYRRAGVADTQHKLGLPP